MMVQYTLLFIFLVFFLRLTTSQAAEDQDAKIRAFLQDFHARPQHYTQRRLEQFNPTYDFSILAAPKSNDLAREIVDGGEVESNLETLDQKQLTSAKLVQTPWADSYWPFSRGSIGVRYSDPHFPWSRDFKKNYDYVIKKSAAEISRSKNPTSIDELSPAEKYDLLVGDSKWTLTNYVWNLGKYFQARYSVVPNWMGICHGWAAAASEGVPVSHQPISVKSVNHVALTFYPSDIKALITLLWANAAPKARFTGTRCDTQNPARNPQGRVIDPSCFDNNPATFHLVLTNQLGMNHRSFIMDGVYDLEVWNYPLTSYSYKYFNPENLEPTTDLRQAVIPIESFGIDKFKPFRSPQTRFIVGIVMNDTYVLEISPNRGPQNTSPLETARHVYDLELDADFEILGGEWYSVAHPDFIWTFDANAQAESIVDGELNSSDWILGEAVPATWTEFAQQASKRGEPVQAIIKALLDRERN